MEPQRVKLISVLNWTCNLLNVNFRMEATKEEILETISVNMAMSGTTGIAESLRVLKLLDELGKL